MWSTASREGQQPDPARIDEVGYLMRTTAVYGSGKFGAADHNAMAGRPLMDGPFRVEMLTVWLIRAFVADLVEHMAAAAAATGPCASTPICAARLASATPPASAWRPSSSTTPIS
jgi:hypothetical protein